VGDNGRIDRIGEKLPTRRGITSDFNLGGEQAEADPLLEEAFYESSMFRSISSRRDRHCFLIGRTGSGKSSILQRLEESEPEHVIRINPENLSLPYITDLNVMRYLDSLGVHLDPFFKALWKHIFLVEIIRHQYRINDVGAKRRFLAELIERVKRDPSKKQALEYLNDFGESFWCETDERVKEITTSFETRVNGAAEATVGNQVLGRFGIGAGADATTRSEIKAEETLRFQRVVNDTQLPRLNKMIEVLRDEILGSAQDFTFVVIDDLDRGWIDDRLTNDLIRCLFQAVLDLQRVKNLKIVVALRTNIFTHLNFGSGTGGQEEKFRSLAHFVTWSDWELKDLANKRAVVAAAQTSIGAVSGLEALLPPTTKKRGHPFNYVLDRTLMRPRDVIAFVNESFSQSSGKKRLTWADMDTAELRYSQNRLLALRDEWKPTFAGIGDVFDVFRGAPPLMSRDELGEILDDVALLPAEINFQGSVWLTQMTEPLWDGVGRTEWAEQYSKLVQLLYDIGFIGIRNRGERVHHSYDDPGHADSHKNLGPAARFEVHRCFRPALDIS